MTPAPKRFAYLEHRRIRAGYTRTKLAKQVGWSVSQISRVEAGICSPTPELFIALAKALDTDIDELIANAPRRLAPSRNRTSAVAS